MPQLGFEAGKRHIKSAAHNLPLAHVGPRTGAAVAGFEVNAKGVQADVLFDTRHIDPTKLGKYLARPFAPLARTTGQQGLPENTAQAKTLTPLSRRSSVQAHQMTAATVSQYAINLAQDHWRCLAQLVVPAHCAAFDGQLGLRKNPVSGRICVAMTMRNIESANIDLAVDGPADFKHRLVYKKLFKPPPPKRGRRQGSQQAWQPQSFAPLQIEQHHITQLKRRYQALGSGCDLADVNSNP